MDPVYIIFLAAATALFLWLAYQILLAIILIPVLFVLSIAAAIEALMDGGGEDNDKKET
jgi:hypothetical protein